MKLNDFRAEAARFEDTDKAVMEHPEVTGRGMVAEGDCILADGSQATGGYRQTRFRGRLWLAHRLCWTVRYGPIPKGKVIRHLCHAPSCIRLDHLAIGTQVDNAADDVARGVRPQPKNDKYHRYHVSEKGRARAREQKKTDAARARQRVRDALRRAIDHDVREVSK